MGFRIRPSQIADTDALGRVHSRSWHESYTGIIAPQILATAGSVERRTAIRRDMFAHSTPQWGHFLVETNDGEIVGFGDCGPARDQVKDFADAEIYTLYLLRTAQGCGLGRLLLKQMFDHLYKQGFTKTALKTHAGSLQANQFYAHLGGHKVSEIKSPDWNENVYLWSDLKGFGEKAGPA